MRFRRSPSGGGSDDGPGREAGSDGPEQRYDRLSGQATLAAQQGRHEEARQLSAEALDVCRRLSAQFPDDPRHRPVLAAALYNHAGRLGRARAEEALGLLAEAEEHYLALADSQPRRFAVRRLDVLTRTGRTLQDSGDPAGAVQRYRQALRAYPEAPTDDEVERDLGLARAHFGLGRCLLLSGPPAAALEDLDAGLFTAERVREEQGIEATQFSWLARAPLSFRLAAPDWMSGAVCAMELHHAAGRFGIAGDAANIALRVAGGLGAIGGAAEQARFEAILARAQQVGWDAESPLRAAAERAGPYGEVLVGGGSVLLGGQREPDVPAMLRLAGWA